MRARGTTLFLLAMMLFCVSVAARQKPAGQPYDPYRAAKNLRVGEYYMKKGNYDAAIDRFKEAIFYRPNLGRAYLLLARAYEKKGDPAEAVAAYKRYLEVFPSADDAEKIRKRIARLESEIKKRPAPREKPPA